MAMIGLMDLLRSNDNPLFKLLSERSEDSI